MIKFKTKVFSDGVDEGKSFMSEIENEYTYYSTDDLHRAYVLVILKQTNLR